MTGIDWRELVASRLETHPRREIGSGESRDAAVALVVSPDETTDPALLLTRRSGRLRRHRGQWALPGGRLDPGEGYVETALRELSEELGVELSPHQVLGLLDDYVSRSGYRIVPVVVFSPEFLDLRPDPGEVASVHRVGLGELEAAVPTDGKAEGATPNLGVLGTRIFAPTAAILFQFVEVCLRGRCTRVTDFGEPFWAWR